MTDRDEKVSRRYRALGNEEPPPELDRRILAAAREAVSPRRPSQRWAVPASLAAVLVLALGITLRMQMESPGIEVSSPASEYSLPPSAPEAPADKTPAASPPPAAEMAQPKAESKAAAATPSQPARKAAPQRDEQRTEEPPAPRVAAEGAAADAMAMAERRQAKPAQRPEPQAFADRIAPPAAAPAAPPPMAQSALAPPVPSVVAPSASVTQAAPAEAQVRSKRESLGATAQKLAKENVADPKERELRRIAELRREGRHAEADEALKKFRADHPDYKIPEALWEQVKPR